MKLTKAQRWCLDAASKARVIPGGRREVHTSFATGEQWFRAPWRTVERVRAMGWIAGNIVDGYRITDAGRKALEGGDG